MRWTRAAVIAGVLALMSCTSQGTTASGLAGSEWRPLEVAGTEIPADAGLFVQFRGEGKLRGHGGCNGFFGSYRLDGDGIEIGPLGATRMACAGDVMARETVFLETLAKARQFRRDRIDLLLSDADGNPLVRLIQTDAD